MVGGWWELFELWELGGGGGVETYLRGVARVRLRVRLSAASEVGRDTVMEVLGAIRDAARPKALNWRTTARVDT